MGALGWPPRSLCLELVAEREQATTPIQLEHRKGGIIHGRKIKTVAKLTSRAARSSLVTMSDFPEADLTNQDASFLIGACPRKPLCPSGAFRTEHLSRTETLVNATR
jgi:hypothetical protein